MILVPQYASLSPRRWTVGLVRKGLYLSRLLRQRKTGVKRQRGKGTFPKTYITCINTKIYTFPLGFPTPQIFYFTGLPLGKKRPKNHPPTCPPSSLYWWIWELLLVLYTLVHVHFSPWRGKEHTFEIQPSYNRRLILIREYLSTGTSIR